MATKNLSFAQYMDENQPTFVNPIITSIPSSADPWFVYKDGFYYYATSDALSIWIWKAATITGIDHGIKTRVWQAPAKGVHSKQLWAPELHFFNDKWYIYYAASGGTNPTHRMYVIESDSLDAQGTYSFKGKIADPTNRWAIDGTVFCKEDDQTLYFIWSGWPGKQNGLQNLYIAPMTNAWTVSGERSLLATPTYQWEGWINEGPQVLQHDGKVFVVYSANASWKAEYSLGMLTYNGSGNILDGAAWHKSPKPVFTGDLDDAAGAVYSTGHCSFVKSPDGSEDWLIYHGKDTKADGWVGRQTRAQRFGWTADGLPDFGRAIAGNMAQARPAGEYRPTTTATNIAIAS